MPMLAALAWLAMGTQNSVPYIFQGSQITVRHVKDFHYSRGELRFGSDLSSVQLTYRFEKQIPSGQPDPSDPPVRSYQINGRGAKKWLHYGPCTEMPMEILSDGKTVIPYQPRACKGFVVIDARTGCTLWSHKPSSETTDMLAALDNEILYRFDEGHLIATKARSGEVIWDHPILARATNMRFSPMIIRNGRLFVNVVEEGTRLFCIDTQNGNERWSVDTGLPVWINDDHNIPGFALSKNKLVIYEYGIEGSDGLQRQSLACIDLNNGVLLWKKPIPYTAFPFAPLASDSCAFTQTNRKGTLFSLKDGKEIASFDCSLAQMKGNYIIDVEQIDRDDYLILHSASTGELIGQLKITPQDYWIMMPVAEHLLIYRLLTAVPNPGIRVYEITETPH
jgi:outer membrane protein assembly factor BamB